VEVDCPDVVTAKAKAATISKSSFFIFKPPENAR